MGADLDLDLVWKALADPTRRERWVTGYRDLWVRQLTSLKRSLGESAGNS
ncbi:MAG TPA: hypothetical protein VF720_04915 [Candidatus Eisenbacteria bacterium]